MEERYDNCKIHRNCHVHRIEMGYQGLLITGGKATGWDDHIDADAWARSNMNPDNQMESKS
jgi:hypothetical protein